MVLHLLIPQRAVQEAIPIIGRQVTQRVMEQQV